MTAAITGAAIGFLVWFGLELLDAMEPTPRPASILGFTVFSIAGAAIGWLIGLAS